MLAFLAVLLCIIAGCSNTRYLTEGQTLYNGSKIKITDTGYSKSFKSGMEEELEGVVTPLRNKKFLGMRLKLSFYNWAGTPRKEKGLRNWIKEKLGEPPVYGEDFNPKYNQGLLNNYLQNRGFFYNTVNGTAHIDKQYTTGAFEVYLGSQYRYNKIDYAPSDSSQLSKDIGKMYRRSLLKEGAAYDLSVIKEERERINKRLKNRGYYYFSPDYIIIYADTTIGDHLVNARVRLRYDIIPQRAYKQYTIRKIQVYPNYQFLVNTDTLRQQWLQQKGYDTVHYGGLDILERRAQFRPRVFRESILYEPGDKYSLRKQNASLSRLINLGVFKFVKNEYKPVRDTNNTASLLQNNAVYAALLNAGLADTSSSQLDLAYYLTQQPRKQISAEFGGFTQNDSRAGSKATLSWRNRNLFKGVELLTLKLTGGFEAQYAAAQKSLPNTYNIGANASINIPRMITPFFHFKGAGMYVPRTIASVGYNFYLRRGLYRIHTFDASFGYNWKVGALQEHKLFPFNVTYVHTDTFSTVSKYDYNLSNLLFNGVIFGPTYEYTYNTQSQGGRKHDNDFYFNGQADLSGNIVGLLQHTSVNRPPEKILDANYAQYLKFQADFRYYRKMNSSGTHILAARAMAGVGFPYGNSQTLPNIKQFFSGGSSSLRGFPARLVGPGTYYVKNNNDTAAAFIEMLGDIKLEANLEYRTKIYQFIDGAVFMDAGNIWLWRDNPDFPGGKFSKDFMKQMAVDAGLGLRFDFSILLLRFDFGIPLRKPWLPEGDRWVINKIAFGDPSWRKDNFVFSLAIGYPF